MHLDRLASWLRCPTCGEDFQAAPPLTLRCARGHAVDVNRRGYVSLLPPRTRVVGDSSTMLDARARFLARGHYSAIVEALRSALTHLPAARDASPRAGLRVIDAGCGTGHYLRALLEAENDAVGLAADLSPAAVATAVRGHDRVDGVVADTWSGLPFRDGGADVILDVFAPRNLPEFHRVLRPHGLAVVVAAGPDHLEQLRSDGRALGIQQDKRERILEAADPLFELVSEDAVRRVMRLTADDVEQLLGMGPSAHHREAQRSPAADSALASAASGGAQDVTMDVMVHVLRRRDGIS